MLGKMDERIKPVLGALKEISGVEPCEEPLWCDVKDAGSMEGLERGLQLSSVEARGLHGGLSTILRNMDILVAMRKDLRPIRF
jgi:hypothetical protein